MAQQRQCVPEMIAVCWCRVNWKLCWQNFLTVSLSSMTSQRVRTWLKTECCLCYFVQSEDFESAILACILAISRICSCTQNTPADTPRNTPADIIQRIWSVASSLVTSSPSVYQVFKSFQSLMWDRVNWFNSEKHDHRWHESVGLVQRSPHDHHELWIRKPHSVQFYGHLSSF